MAHYLPVLLVSVNTNATPDDSSVSTLPRGQVDYLSHEWEEEDVWRSWRNMTRQKNEIANGMRLENASWRTWWKQRNKLKTVTPETLNWLKDSDVTWLYGPLHTAVDWAPPPKPKPDPTEVGKDNSAHDRLDLVTHAHSPIRSTLSRYKSVIPSTDIRISAATTYATSSHYYTTPSHEPEPNKAATWHKSILKHRSISELLTSDLPSPLWSEDEDDNDEVMGEIEEEGSASSREEDEEDYTSPHSGKRSGDVGPDLNEAKRPKLAHIKSDSHVEKWGPNRAFRKPSPPRIVALEPRETTSTNEVVMSDGFLATNGSSSSGSNANSASTSNVSTPGSSSDNLGPRAASPKIHSSPYLGGSRSPVSRSSQCTPDECLDHPNAPPHTHSYGSYFSSRAHPSHVLAAQSHGFADGSFPHTAHHAPTRNFSSGGLNSVRPNAGSRTTSRANSRDGRRREPPPKKKHITFNTFVEQCISVDQPKISSSSRQSSSGNLSKSNSFGNGSRNGSFSGGFPGTGMGPGVGMGDFMNAPGLKKKKKATYDDVYDDEQEDDFSRGQNWVGRGSTAWPKQSSEISDSDSDSNDEDDEDEVLEMRSHHGSRRPQPPSSHHSSSSNASSSSSGPFRPALVPSHSSEKEHMTIAPIAPTTLKTIGVGNGWVDGFGDDGGLSDDGVVNAWYTGYGTRSRSRAGQAAANKSNTPVELVYVPPHGSNYIVPSEETTPMSLKEDGRDEEVVWHLPAAGQSTVVPAVGVVRSPPLVVSHMVLPREPLQAESFGDGAEEDAYDYFGGPDLGEDFASRKTVSGSRRSREDVREDVREDNEDSAIKYGSPVVAPKVVLNRAAASPPARSPVPSPPPLPASPAVAVPIRIGSLDNSSMLSPPIRGRTSSSSSFDGDGRGESRGRSVSRVASSSSLSRSGSKGTNSPLGSISPEGSKANLAGSVPIQRRGRSSAGGVSRKMSSSLSPDHVASTSPVVRRANSNSSLASSNSTVMPTKSLGSSSLPPVIPEEEVEEEEVQRSMHPTPSNSPTLRKMEAVVTPSMPIVSRSTGATSPPTKVSTPPPSSPSTLTSSRGSIFRHSRGGSKDGSLDESGNVVGRAVGIAGAFLGSMWRS